MDYDPWLGGQDREIGKPVRFSVETESPDTTIVPLESVAAFLKSFIDSHPAWVIEGCYGELVRKASAHCTLLVFLNPGMDACLANNLKRPWEPHKYASLELQNAMLDQLQTWVAGYYHREDAYSYRVHREIFDAFTGPKIDHHEVGAYAA